MFIKAELYDGECVTVSQEGLDRLLERHLAKCFERSSGWAVVGMHPIRSTAHNLNSYSGPERRHMDKRH
ncbi:MAG: hypothetical protein NDI73_08740 [Desulfuromonadales bacterium]|nr:hypothetical protein [Desulfuromonadales bacterium]